MKRKSFGQMECPIAQTLEVVGEWWTPLILREVVMNNRTRFDELLDAQAELVKKLPAMDDEEVTRFLENAAAQSGAPLAALTDNVRAWLKTHRMSSKYSIRRS